MEPSTLTIGIAFFLLSLVVILLGAVIKIQVKNIVGKLKEVVALLLYIKPQIHDLYVWHDKDDEDGVKLWYVRKSLETAIKSLSDNVAKQTEVLGQFLIQLKETRKDVGQLEDKIDHLAEKK